MHSQQLQFAPHGLTARAWTGQSYASAWAKLTHWHGSAPRAKEVGMICGGWKYTNGMGKKGALCSEIRKAYVKYRGRSDQTLSETKQHRCSIGIVGKGVCQLGSHVSGTRNDMPGEKGEKEEGCVLQRDGNFSGLGSFGETKEDLWYCWVMTQVSSLHIHLCR